MIQNFEDKYSDISGIFLIFADSFNKFCENRRDTITPFTLLDLWTTAVLSKKNVGNYK